jgi:2-methylcitrate dehydratase PrpD
LSPPVAKNVTRVLARYIVGAKYEDLLPNVRKEGVRRLLNWVGVTICGSHQPAVDIAVSALTALNAAIWSMARTLVV